jgi:hypothetical protein
MPAGLSPLVVALGPSAAPHARPLRRQRALVRFGPHALVHEVIDWRLDSPPCPLAGEGPCALFRVRAGGGPWGPVFRAPRAWAGFSGGAAVAYAFRGDASVSIDSIDQRGAVTPWLVDEHFEASTSAVVETQRGAYVVGFRNDEAFVAAVLERDGKRHLGEAVPLGIDSVDGRPNAQSARSIEERKLRASWGDLHPVALLEPDGRPTGTWALVWTQVVPPPYGHPPGKPYRRRERRGAKHDCGSSPTSRALTDPSIEKRIVMQVFDGTRRIDDRFVDHPATLDLDARQLDVAAIPGGVAIDGVAHDLRGKRLDATPPRTVPVDAPDLAASVPDEEEPTGLAFDRASGEGLALFRRGQEESFGRRFDASGAFLGEPFPLHDGVATGDTPLPLARINDAWIAFDGAEGRMAWLTGPRAGAVVPLERAGSPIGLVPIAPGQAALFANVEGKSVTKITIDVLAGTVSPPETMTGLSQALAAFVRSDGVPCLIERPSMRVIDARTGAFAEPEGDTGRKDPSELRDVGSDAVLVWRGPSEATLWWLGAGSHASFPGASFPRDPGVGTPGVLPGPLLASGATIPSSPGEPVETDAAAVRALCPLSVALSPGHLVMACSEPLDPLVPGVRAGLRTLRFEERKTTPDEPAPGQ